MAVLSCPRSRAAHAAPELAQLSHRKRNIELARAEADDSDQGDEKMYGKAAIAMSKNSNAALDWTAYCLLIARVDRDISIVSDQHKFPFLTFIQVRFS